MKPISGPIDRSTVRAAGERGRHQRVGRKNKRRDDNFGAADARTRYQIWAP